MPRQMPAHYRWMVALIIGVAPSAQAQNPFVPSADVVFTVRTDHRHYEIGDDITVHYTIKNVSNGPIYVPKAQWDISCRSNPHLWGVLEDTAGKHFEPGFGGSCMHPNRADQMTISERMQEDAVLLKPGQLVSGSYPLPMSVFGKSLEPGAYRLEAILYGWNLDYSESELTELKTMRAPFLGGESNAVVLIELKNPAKL